MRVIALVAGLVLASAPRVFAQPNTDPDAAEAPGTSLPPSTPPPPSQPPFPLAMRGDGFAFHRGLTFEANLGIHFTHVDADQYGDPGPDRFGAGGVDLGLGWFITRRLAITLRFANGSFTSGGNLFALSFIGPSAQLWLGPHVWIGAGVGLSGLVQLGGCDSTLTTCSSSGIGFDGRLGYTFGGTANTINISVEVTPGYYGSGSQADLPSPQDATGIALLFGYQYL